MNASTAPLPTPPPGSRRLRRAGATALLLAAALAIAGIAARMHDDRLLKQRADTEAIPTVRVVEPGRVAAREDLLLPGNVHAWYDAPIYARVSGYLKQWHADIGTPVKSGQLLAEIETPELDQQLLQARADLATAQAHEKLAAITAKRWRDMLASNSVSQQEADEKTGDYEAKQAATAAARANVERLQALESFKRIVAPFDGIVTARRTDVGALINAGSGNGHELFRVADTRKLRVYVHVPQTYASEIRTDMAAQLSLPEQPGQTYPARVIATANAIDETSRTLLVQLEADNADGRLTAGSYVEVRFDLPAPSGALQLPVSALLFRRHGLKVATLGPGDRVVLKSIQIGRDYGTRVEVVSGLTRADRVIDSPPDWLGEGDLVRVASIAPTPAKPLAATSATP
jgi:RND family efflux transporter MFP subunit